MTAGRWASELRLPSLSCQLSLRMVRTRDRRPVYELHESHGLPGRFCCLWDTAHQFTDCTDGHPHVAKVRVASSNLVIRSVKTRSAAMQAEVLVFSACQPAVALAAGIKTNASSR